MSYMAFCVATFVLAIVCFMTTNGWNLQSLYHSLDALFAKNVSPAHLIVSVPELAFIIIPGIGAAGVAAMICGSVIAFSKVKPNRA